MSHPDIDDEDEPVRRRDPADNPWDRADCCHDRHRFTGEIQRTKNKGLDAGTIPPARVRLCTWHAGVLLRSDPTAKCHPVSLEWGTETNHDMQG